MRTNSIDREALNNFKAMLRSKNIDPDKHIITPTYLRVDQKISNSTTTYRFDIKNTTSGGPLDKKLDINDTFFVTHIGIQNYPHLNTGPRFNHPESYVNKTRYAAAAGFVPDHLNMLYQAKLSVRVGTRTVVEDLDTNRFLQIPMTQQSGATNYSEKSEEQGLVEITPNVVLSGKADNGITLDVPTTEGTLQWANTNANTDNYVTFIVKGFLVKSINL